MSESPRTRAPLDVAAARAADLEACRAAALAAAARLLEAAPGDGDVAALLLDVADLCTAGSALVRRGSHLQEAAARVCALGAEQAAEACRGAGARDRATAELLAACEDACEACAAACAAGAAP